MSVSQQSQKKDHWSSQAYNSAAGFVPKLTSTVLSYLDPQPSDHILDIGCGDGSLTAKIAQSVHSGRVLGLDASKSFIETAQAQYTSPNCTFELQDATALESFNKSAYDKVFSNAAMHWILRQPATRKSFFRDIHAALKPGGSFVFEMGGTGNVAEIQAAALAVLVHAGVPLDRAREASPWFFPSTDWMSASLAEAGFEVEKCEIEYRPTKMTAATADGSGGIEGWTRLMCAEFLDAVPEGKREQAVREICDLLETVITREEDGSKWIGNVRLRAVARKK